MNLKNIIEGCKNNERQAQGALYEELSSLVMNTCIRYSSNQFEADDIFQDAFIQLFKRISSYDDKRKDANFNGWVYRLVSNVALKHIRSKQRNDHDDLDNHVDEESLIGELDDNISHKEIQGYVQALPDGQRLVFNLNTIEGYSHEEIGEKLNISATTSRGHLFKARVKLQKMYLANQRINE